MIFTQFEYPIFLLIIAILVWLVPSLRIRKQILLVASLYFYAYWDWRFLALLCTTICFDWCLALQISRAQSPTARRLYLSASVASNLVILGFFKYYNFFIASAQEIFSGIGWHAGSLNIVLPLGISFFTFQSLSYTIDVYRGHLQARKSLFDYALFVSFFPQLVAGPIIRATELLPQFDQRPGFDYRSVYAGCQQILRGYLKKVLIADHLARAADAVFGSPEVFSSGTMALGLLAWTGQIYGDFAGYSDIAIGSARVLGFHLPENFHHPYLATSIQDFWRRWHMSLSSWLRDYLYIPLGGSRHGELRTHINLLVTMTLGGLWHGAAWTFVLWGIWHGGWLCVHRLWLRITSRTSTIGKTSSIGSAILGWTLTFTIVVIGWTLFRAGDMTTWRQFWTALLTNSGTIEWYPPQAIIALTWLVGEHLVWLTRYRSMMLLPIDRWYSPILTGLALWALAIFAPQVFRPFVYFQF